LADELAILIKKCFIDKGICAYIVPHFKAYRLIHLFYWLRMADFLRCCWGYRSIVFRDSSGINSVIGTDLPTKFYILFCRFSQDDGTLKSTNFATVARFHLVFGNGKQHATSE
jgi:hypothetical protein